ncbi:uncharacterized protein LOC130805378 [Amaranthus tricolor]|uniref:uncharacterized protein LOC130805378 n=1 Tax=Amaranthus tricolor TaxID=29722 RepID=UPI0025847B08|nr:uncharacterized protein LOC130805378 [Amaranthus tricolor]
MGLDMLMNMFAGLGTGDLGAPENPNVPPEELYATQLTQLQEMGFLTRQRILGLYKLLLVMSMLQWSDFWEILVSDNIDQTICFLNTSSPKDITFCGLRFGTPRLVSQKIGKTQSSGTRITIYACVSGYIGSYLTP